MSFRSKFRWKPWSKVAMAGVLILTLGLGGSVARADDAAQAAARFAEQKYGGRVLKVEREDGAYRVKLLQPSGKVKTVRVPVSSLGSESPRKSEQSRDSERDKGS